MPTELQKAIETENLDLLERILKKSPANPNFTDKMGLTPLHYAAYFGKREIVAKLLALGADPNHRIEKYNSTPLQWATYSGIKNAPKLNCRLNSDVIKELIHGGAVYDIMSAVANSDLPQVQKILKANPLEVNSKWMNGFSPLHINNNYEIGDFLLHKRGEINQQSDDKTTPLIYLCSRLTPDVKVVQLYIQRGGQVNAQNDAHRTALHGAVRRGHEEIVKLLLIAGASKTVKNKKGETPLDKAIKLKKASIMVLLKERAYK
jgi:ankyrin repeat protein